MIRYTRGIVYTRERSTGRGQLVLNGNSWDVGVVAESGDMVGGGDQVDELMENFLATNSSSLISPEVSSKSTTARGADASFAINKLFPTPQLPSSHPSISKYPCYQP